ncbi:uncharacterized protein LOC135690766 isoform X2 [Rhopilema esculentum]|uniref:uncharacterized protein LOC135690766 isoform X2 n=1 Tax=Rhopilema esculentum TaxID=499914 RepID=UPI0031E209CD
MQFSDSSTKVWRQKWFTLRRKSGLKQHRLEYHKSEDSCLRGKHTTIIPLQTLIDVSISTSKTHENVFRLAFSDGIKWLFFATHNESEMKEWIRIIRKLIVPEPRVLPPLQGTCPEGLFSVTIVCTEDSESLSLAGDYFLSVSPEHLKLYKKDEVRNLRIQWHLEDIPRFRLQRLCHLHDGEKIFIINVARTSQSGKGEFHFLTQNGREILECVKSHTKRLHQGRVHDDSARSTPLGVPSSLSSSAIIDSRSRSSSNNSQSLSLRPADSVTSRSSKSS